MPNRIQLSIAGFNLVVTTDEDTDRVEELARAIERDILAVTDGAVRASSGKAAIVCALEYYDKLQKASESSVNLRNQIRDYMAEAANAKLIIDEREKTIAKLTRELAESTPTERTQELLSQVAAEKEKNALLYRELDGVTLKLNETTEELRQKAEAELPAAHARIAELENQLAAKQSEGDSAELAELRDDLADITEDARQLRNQNALLQSQKEALLSRAMQAEEQAEALHAQLETLEKMIEEDGLVAREPQTNLQSQAEDLPYEPEEEGDLEGEPEAESVPENDSIDEDFLQREPEQEPFGSLYDIAGKKPLSEEIPKDKAFRPAEGAKEVVIDYPIPGEDEQEFYPVRDVEIGFGNRKGTPLPEIKPEAAEQPGYDIVEPLEEKPPLYGLVFPDDDMPNLNWTDEVLNPHED